MTNHLEQLMSVIESKTYSALLHGDRLEWLGEAPVEMTDDGAVRVEVKVLSPKTADSSESAAVAVIEDESSRRKRGALMAASLRRLSDLSAFAEVSDPVAWQREQRKDRPLPGREE